MKHISLLCFVFLFFVSTKAQTPFNTIDSITINKINAAVLVHGDMGWDPITQGSRTTFTRNRKEVLGFASSIWMSANDGMGQLHVAAQMYRQEGNDYWPGPLDNTGALSYATSGDWARIWKVDRTDIQLFLVTTPHTLSNVPQTILEWPAKGNASAKGNGGVSLTISDPMAPFVDVNGNGIYEPLSGDYPDVKGDQALWWVFSDNGPTHSQSSGSPLGVEVHAMAYAYSRGTLLDCVVYYEYDVVNRSLNNYANFRLGLFEDLELGLSLDDYTGFDSSRRLAIGYNWANGGGAATPENFYAALPPQVGITMISQPGDVCGNYLPAGSFGYFNNDFSIIGNPSTGQHYDYYLRSRFLNGQHFTRYISGPCAWSGPMIETNYMGADPALGGSFTECACANAPGDRRIVLTTSDFVLNSGGSQKVVFAFVAADTGAGGCSSTLTFNRIKATSDTARERYCNPPAPLPLSNVDVSVTSLRVYPNPAFGYLFIEGLQNVSIVKLCTVYNTLGQAVQLAVLQQDKKLAIDIHTLPAGIYQLRLSDSSTVQSATFVKE